MKKRVRPALAGLAIVGPLLLAVWAGGKGSAAPRQHEESRATPDAVPPVVERIEAPAAPREAFEQLERSRALAFAKEISAEALKPSDLPAIQAELGPEALLLAYSLGTRESFLWLVSSDSVDSYVLPPRATLEEEALRARGLLAEGYRRETKVTLDLVLARLGSILLGPVEPKLGTKSLLIVPDGALHLVPFAALPAGSGAAEPLLVRHTIVSLPAASLLTFLRQRAEERAQPEGVLAAIGDPVFSVTDPRLRQAAAGARSPLPGPSGPELPRLVHSGRETRQILSLVPPGKAAFSAFGFAANRQTVLDGALRGYRFVHFATHAITNPVDPARSGLLLSSVDEEGRHQQPLLRPAEIDTLDLSSDLVVLSACSTGWDSDGMAPLARSFLRAGASRVLMSYWDVDDQATALLMSRFYQHLLGKEGLPPAAALREAQLSMRKDRPWTSPYYWAGFGLLGDWR